MTDVASDGGRTPRVSDEEILRILRQSKDPVLSTGEVAEQLPIKRRGTLNRLRKLEESESVRGKSIGGRNKIWWLENEKQQ